VLLVKIPFLLFNFFIFLQELLVLLFGVKLLEVVYFQTWVGWEEPPPFVFAHVVFEGVQELLGSSIHLTLSINKSLVVLNGIELFLQYFPGEHGKEETYYKYNNPHHESPHISLVFDMLLGIFSGAEQVVETQKHCQADICTPDNSKYNKLEEELVVADSYAVVNP
jgi:hypothetical protein